MQAAGSGRTAHAALVYDRAAPIVVMNGKDSMTSDDLTTSDPARYAALQAEIVTLRQRIAELEAPTPQGPSEYQLAIEAALDGIAILDSQGIYRYMNDAHAAIHGYACPKELLGQPWSVVVPDDLMPWYEQECMPVLWRVGSWRGEVISKRRDGSLHPTELGLTTLQSGGLVCVLRDLTEQKQAEAERLQLQETIIQTQAAALAEMSTPLIPITDQIMVMPLVGTLDSRRAQQVIETLLHGVSANRAQVAILDITGVPIVDTQVANALLQAAQSVQLLGAQVILTGIRPEVAQTLVGLGVDLSTVITRSSLQSGIAYAIGTHQRSGLGGGAGSGRAARQP
jgi:rsbT co-antagonist protein RsbR